MTQDIIDAYCHCGLYKYRPIVEVREAMDRLGFSRTVLVQHLGEYDNSYIEGIVAGQPERFAGVMFVDVEDPKICDRVCSWAEKGNFRGIRLIARTVDSHPEIWEQADRLGLNIIVYDEPTIASYSDSLRKFAISHPETRIVLSHLGVLGRQGKPELDNHRRILDLADQDNVYVQLSGFHMFAEPPYTELVPIVERLIESFGPKRLLYGTNFPIPKDVAACQSELDLMLAGDLGVGKEALDDILNKTAMKLWFDKLPRE